MHALVAGGSGFVGRHLVRALLARGHRVSVLGRRPAFEPPVDEIRVSDWDAPALAEALRERAFDYVFNLAAAGVHPGERDRDLLVRINVECAQALTRFSAGARVRAHLHVGSSAEYDCDTPHRLQEDAPRERNRLYGRTKSEGTLACTAIAEASGLPFVAARLFGTYGPGEAPHRLLPALMSKLAVGARVPLTPGVQVRDMMHVEDAAEGMIALAEAAAARGRGARIVNLCTGEPVTVRRFSEIAAAAIGADLSLLGFGEQPYRPDDLMHVVGDPARLHALTSWRPKHKVETGIPRAVAQMRGRSAAGPLS